MLGCNGSFSSEPNVSDDTTVISESLVDKGNPTLPTEKDCPTAGKMFLYNLLSREIVRNSPLRILTEEKRHPLALPARHSAIWKESERVCRR